MKTNIFVILFTVMILRTDFSVDTRMPLINPINPNRAIRAGTTSNLRIL